ncbi:glycosyltransferase family 2 protein [Xanthobacteraceae bacterium Astr-EGSB]|uniref:glycosyltransferase family 2 protein n=1 Tax=Astrobacterium formosum TaxID=3069710 RepID=UPI0027B35C34|nr:glycosyltransferase family 2 protein [Xanthobacteraceae bacterium Astr-EGSB]
MVHLEDAQRIFEATELCREEIEIIRDVIAQKKIEFPKHLSKLQDPIRLEVQGPYVSESLTGDSRVFRGPPPSSSSDRISVGARLMRFIAGPLAHRAFDKAAQALLPAVPQGTILIIGGGIDGCLFADVLRRAGRRAVAVEPGYGSARQVLVPGLLERPASGSLGVWLQSADNATLAALGAAVVLVRGTMPEVDIELLRDARDDLPILTLERQTATGWQLAGPLPATGAVREENWPKISVVTVSFNQARYLEESIKSVLDQNYPHLEYIIIDGGSTDGSVEIIDKYRSRCAAVVVEPDKGQSDALNKGFKLATGDLMNWLCSDDLLEPGALRQVGRNYLRHRADLIAGGCVRIQETRDEELYRHHTSVVMGETARLDPLDILKFMRSWQKGNYFFQPEVFFSRRIWEEAGAFIKPHLFYVMDYDLWLRMALAGASIRHVPGYIACSRVHSQQKTQDDQAYLYQVEQLIAEYEQMFEQIARTVKPNSDGGGAGLKVGRTLE